MECRLVLGATCVLLEDLGFTKRGDLEHQPMTYYYSDLVVQRVYADIIVSEVIELLFNKLTIEVDRWQIDPDTGMYQVIEELSFSIHDPKSIPLLTSYIKREISNVRLQYSETQQ